MASSRGGKGTSPSKTRAARRCRICPDNPLKAGCPCPRGRKALKVNNTLPSPDPVLSKTLSPGSRSLRPTKALPPKFRSLRLSKALSLRSRSPHPPNTQLALSQVNPNDNPPISPGASFPTTPVRTQVHGTQVEVQPNAALGPYNPETASPAKKGPPKRIFPSGKNPLFKTVKGAARGSVPILMPRVRKLKARYLTAKASSRAYDNLTRDIITRCEDIAERTNSWVYFAVQNPASKTPFLNYASRKFRKDAKEELKEIHKLMGKTMSTVKAADRASDLSVVRVQELADEKVKEANDLAAQAEKALREAQEEIERLKADMATQKSVRDLLLGLHAIPPLPSNDE
ncbi:hypothetical protein DFP72DRAFT_1075015 [Ephemerocybe angulata]|uniref:Uncharacterized protein n=1 Tax=Ephemerocybe angulata TaxID=980116 RepID=A0A8H6HIQ5_9AGAR|nr:hypothetical protein DFP72DRAFT_1075015 [Tulosesus angulatus]